MSILRKTMTAGQAAILEHLLNSQHPEKLTKKATEKFEEASKNLYRHFQALKSGILKQASCVSSLREKNGSLNFNCLYARQFMTSVLEAAVQHLKEIRGKFDDKIRTVQKLPEEVQRKLYTKFYGAAQFDMQVEKHFSALRPWVYQWVEVQVPSIVQREIFARDRKALEVFISLRFD